MTSKPQISVVTRTYERIKLLDRCFESIRGALGENSEWLVVDDAPAKTAGLEERLNEHQKKVPFNIRYIHSGLGNRTKALNVGLEQASGSYLHIIDDDDTVNTDFYRVMSAYLDHPKHQSIGSVACLCLRIDESLSEDGVYVETRRRRHYPEQEWVSFASLATRQQTPLCSLLFRRSVIGALRFDENFENSEDHDFLLRFLLRADIAVLRQELAFYHHRPTGTGSEANSDISRSFGVESAHFRNALMRRDLKNNEVGLGWLVTMAELQNGSTRINTIIDKFYRVGLINRLYQWFRK